MKHILTAEDVFKYVVLQPQMAAVQHDCDIGWKQNRMIYLPWYDFSIRSLFRRNQHAAAPSFYCQADRVLYRSGIAIGIHERYCIVGIHHMFLPAVF